MMRLSSAAVGAVIGATVVVAGGLAYAAIPDNGGVVSACYQVVTAATKPVKLLDTGQAAACPSGWKKVTWNQKGAPGPTGPAGAVVKLRARLTAPVTLPPGQSTTASLTSSSWTQGPNEFDEVYADLAYDFASDCTGDGMPISTVTLDGAPFGTLQRLNADHLWEPGSPKSHSVSITLHNTCLNQDMTISKASIDVIGVQ